MAFHDQNGRITIDENAANIDIRRMKEAREKLQASLSAIENLRRDTGSMEGDAATAILEKSEEMRKKLQAMIDKIDAYTDFITRVVKRYQQIDADLKKTIEAARPEAGGGYPHSLSEGFDPFSSIRQPKLDPGRAKAEAKNNTFKPFG